MEIIILLIIGLVIGYTLGSSKSNINKNMNSNQVEKFRTDKSDKHKVVVKPIINIKKKSLESITLSKEQSDLFKIIDEENISAYITGKAGTGKSVLLQYFVDNTGKNVAVVAPTGVSALNIGGQTIHSFFQLAPELQDLSSLRVDDKTKELLKSIDTLVIDEVSMVRADLMEAINLKLKLARGSETPFGGVQLLMFGDLFQLPPVVADGELSRYFDHNYGGVYFFNAPVFKEFSYQVYELNHIFRQQDDEFINLLNAIRVGNASDEILEKLNRRVDTDVPDSGFIILAGDNYTVSRINQTKLNSLESRERVYFAEITGNINEKTFPTEQELRLKVGAQVMMLKNDKQKPSRWVNGTLGFVTELSEDIIRINIDGVEHAISKESWEGVKYSYNLEKRKVEKEVVSSFVQFPLKLAWAITIHKSQGQTYQSVAIDLSRRAFASGQTYVALSRCQSLEGLYLSSPIRKGDIIVDQNIVEFMKGLTSHH